MADPIQGVRATAGTNAILSNARVIDMSDRIHLLDPNMAPLTALLMRLRTQTCFNPKFEWQEDDYIPMADTINGTVNSAALEVVMDNGPYFRPGDLVQCIKTGEVMEVTAVNDNTLTITRAIGSTAAGELTDGEVLLIVGNANEENSVMRDIYTAQKTAVYNYCQICRWEFGVSGTTAASKLYGGPDLDYQRKKAAKEFRIQMEKTLLFGERGIDTSGATAKRYTGGVVEKITTNATTLTSGHLNHEEFEVEFIQPGMRYGDDTKLLIVSREIGSYLNLMASDRLEMRKGDSTFPLVMWQYKSIHGNVMIVPHNQLKSYGGTTTVNDDAYQGWAFLLDLDNMKLRPLRNRNTMLRRNIQANDADGQIDGYLAEVGLEMNTEKSHSILKGIVDVKAGISQVS